MIELVKMRRRDLRRVMVIEHAVFPEPWSQAIFASELALRTGRAYRVAREGRETVGYVGLMFVDEEAHVTTVAVAPEHQGKRIGTQIMLGALGIAREAGARHVSLEVAVGNDRAQALYRRFGFVPVGVRRNYYQLIGEDAYVMWAYDIDSPAYAARLARIEGGHGVNVLGIETSCDETAAAVVADGRVVRSSVVSSQIDLHARYGGVVPEFAGRAHVELLVPVVSEALERAGVDRPDAVAVTCGPGLIGSLLVGLSAAKALAMSWAVPFVGVNHLEGHLFAPVIEEPSLEWPLVVLLVSGGHTMLVEARGPGDYGLLGQTLDDAAGEAYDKVARYLGLGYPGGPAIDRVAGAGDPAAFPLPRALLDEGYDFSFSGLKTAVVRTVERHPDASTADLAASFQAAVVDVLVAKAARAVRDLGAKGLCLGGGVAANSLLRRRAPTAVDVPTYLPSMAMCTDNAAMIAAAGTFRLAHDGPSPLSLAADPNLVLPCTT